MHSLLASVNKSVTPTPSSFLQTTFHYLTFFCRTNLIVVVYLAYKHINNFFWLNCGYFWNKTKQYYFFTVYMSPCDRDEKKVQMRCNRKRNYVYSHTQLTHTSTTPHSPAHVLSFFHCVCVSLSLSIDHSGRKDCYVNAPVNRSEWTGLKQIMLNCLLV